MAAGTQWPWKTDIMHEKQTLCMKIPQTIIFILVNWKHDSISLLQLLNQLFSCHIQMVSLSMEAHGFPWHVQLLAAQHQISSGGLLHSEFLAYKLLLVPTEASVSSLRRSPTITQMLLFSPPWSCVTTIHLSRMLRFPAQLQMELPQTYWETKALPFSLTHMVKYLLHHPAVVWKGG